MNIGEIVLWGLVALAGAGGILLLVFYIALKILKKLVGDIS